MFSHKNLTFSDFFGGIELLWIWKTVNADFSNHTSRETAEVWCINGHLSKEYSVYKLDFSIKLLAES